MPQRGMPRLDFFVAVREAAHEVFVAEVFFGVLFSFRYEQQRFQRPFGAVPFIMQWGFSGDFFDFIENFHLKLHRVFGLSFLNGTKPRKISPRAWVQRASA